MRGDGALLKRELKVAAAEQLTVPVKIAVGDKESETLLVGCDLVCLQMAGSAVTLGKMIPVQEWKQGGNGILLGGTLAAELGGGPGDTGFCRRNAVSLRGRSSDGGSCLRTGLEPRRLCSAGNAFGQCWEQSFPNYPFDGTTGSRPTSWPGMQRGC